MEIKLFTNEETEWNNFIKDNNSSIFHTLEWKSIIQNTFGYEPIYLMATQENSVLGIFPIFSIKSFIFGTRLISLPFSFSAGPLAKDDTSLEVLISKSKEIFSEKNGKYLDIRMVNKLPEGTSKKLQLKESFPNFLSVLKLQDTETVWKNLDKKTRNAVRKSEKEGVKVSTVDSDSDMEKYYNLKLETSRKHGIPCEPLKFYKNLFNTFNKKGMIEVFFSEFDNKTIAGIILLAHKGEILYYSGASSDKYLHLRPYNSLIWEAIKWSCDNHFNIFNFGITSVTHQGLLDFKKRWGTENFEIPNYFYSKGEISTEKSTSYGIFTKVWKRIPTNLSKHFGSMLVRHKGG